MEPTRQLPPATPPLVKKTDLATEAAQAVARRAQEQSPLTDEHFQQIARALKLRRPVQKAAATANFSATSTLVIAVASLMFSLISFSWLGILVCLGLLGCGIVEYVGYRRLRRGEEAAPRLLALNQLALFGIITVYCVIQMTQVGHTNLTPDISAADRAQLSGVAGVGSTLDSLDKMIPILLYGFYILVIVSSLMFQGGLALYYYTRGHALMRYRQLTPAWIVRLLNQIA